MCGKRWPSADFHECFKNGHRPAGEEAFLRRTGITAFPPLLPSLKSITQSMPLLYFSRGCEPSAWSMGNIGKFY